MNQDELKKDDPQIGAVGGEALMEGIMMRGPKGAAVALRLADGSIETTMKKVISPADKHKWLGWPLIRGPVNFVWSMIFGYKCLMESSEKAATGAMEGEEVVAESKLDKWLEAHWGPKMVTAITIIGTLLGLGLAVLLFMWAPEKLAGLINKYAPADLSRFIPLISGGVRVVLFVGYMFVMSLLKDIRRVFQYHGAEHKSIFCYEAGLPLTVENVKAQSRLHPRCGTSFLFLMILLSILISSLMMVPDGWREFLKDNILWRMLIKIGMFPLIMALGYEFIRYAGKHLRNPLVRVISAPGLALQRITTKEPDDKIIEVGIAALKAALGLKAEEAEDKSEDDNPAGDADSAGDAPAE